MVLAVVVTAVCYNSKVSNTSEPFDKLRSTLSGIEAVTDPGGNITLQLLGVPNEIPYWVRYALTPRYIAQVAYKKDTVAIEREVNGQKHRMLGVVKTFVYDTALTICPIAAPDSVLRSVVGNRHIIWQNKDERFSYLLTTTH